MEPQVGMLVGGLTGVNATYVSNNPERTAMAMHGLGAQGAVVGHEHSPAEISAALDATRPEGMPSLQTPSAKPGSPGPAAAYSLA